MKCVDEFIERKTLLYKTNVEYGDYTINHLQGCSHGCNYPCYAFMMAKRFGKVKSYQEWCTPKMVSNVQELLEKEIKKYKSKIESVHLSFTTDPFMYEYADVKKLSLKIIKMLNDEEIPCTALTKGLLPIELSKLSSKNEYGITLISLDEDFRKVIEPGASPYMDRIASLYALHKKGCTTWVSIEPYPTPNIINQDFSAILNAVSFVDKIIFGRTNYNPKISKYENTREYYNDLSAEVISFCITQNISYHIKNGTITNKGAKRTS